MSLINDNYSLMQKSLDALWLRQKAISHNLANMDTPGYVAKKVEFENLLAQLLETGDKKQINEQLKSLEPLVVEDETPAIREDGNNVDIDQQNVELLRTQLQYEYMVSILSNAISRQKYVINEGKN